MTDGQPSRTRPHIEDLSERLKKEGVFKILETNVLCYATPRKCDLPESKHPGRKKRGEEIFRFLLKTVKPRVLIVHGMDAVKDLQRHLRKHWNMQTELPMPPSKPGEPCAKEVNGMMIFAIRSLALPEWNKWQEWADRYLTAVAKDVARVLAVRIVPMMTLILEGTGFPIRHSR